MNKLFYVPLLAILLVAESCDYGKFELSDPAVVSKLPVFERLPASVTGLTFANYIKEDVKTQENVFDFDYFYNGAGVGIADLDNDGLQDLVFTGNQEDNKLYRNKGGLQFEDVTHQSGINEGKGWANGVTFVDINQDGWLDIYICQGGLRSAAKRRNKLFINRQGMNCLLYTSDAADD